MTYSTFVLEGLNEDRITINRPTWMQEADIVQYYLTHKENSPKFIIPIIAELAVDDLYNKASDHGVDFAKYNSRAAICAEVLVRSFGIMSVYRMVINLMEKMNIIDTILKEESDNEKN